MPESHQENIPITVVGVSHRSADVNIRERVSFNEAEQDKIMQRLTEKYNTRGVLVLSTCNRTEIYFCGRKATKYLPEICCWLDEYKKVNVFCNEKLSYVLKGREAIQHFFCVNSSLDSQIIGESQITGQVKDSYEKSRQLTYTDILINKMYNFGMQAEKQVRSKTNLTDGAVSVSFAGVELARKMFGNLKNTTVLLIGAGDTAQLAAQNFIKRAVSRILVVNRTYSKASKLAEKFQGEPYEMKKLDIALEQADIVITATSSEKYIVNKNTLEKVAEIRKYKPLFLIDLAIPRDIDPDVSAIEGIFLYNLDDLKEIVQANILQRRKEIPKAKEIIEDYVSEYIKWYNTLPVIKTITQLNHYFDEIREQEFERLKNRFPENSLAEAEYLSKSLMKKFLHHHIITLRESKKDRQKQHMDLVGEIYRLNGSKSEK